MKQKMSWGGIGPKMAVFSLPYFVLTVVLMIIRPEFLQMRFLSPLAGSLIGGILTAGGAVFYGFTVAGLIRGLKKQKLETTGVYGLTRNPLYADFILFIVPGLAFLFRSWLLLAGAAVLYVNFKFLIHEEEELLQSLFGKKYQNYKANVNELIPIPKWMGKK